MKGTRIIKQAASLFLGLLMMTGCIAPLSVCAEDMTDDNVVRVGFFDSPFNISGSNGERSGYAYDYQQEVASYTGWRYEYVKGDWSELLQMLKAGELDLLSDVSYTPDREADMLFSSLPMGAEQYYIYADLSRSGISLSDPSTLNGKKIGVIQDSIPYALFTKWAEENHIHAEVVPLTGYSGIVTKVKSGELDCFVSSEATERNIKSLTGVVCIGGSDIYFAVNKNRPDLKQQLDCAMNRISVSHPFFTEELYKQYISTSTGSVLSAEEISWLDEHGPIRIAYLNNNLAFSDLDEETGELTGALAEYISFAADCLDNRTLEFEAVPFSNITQEMEALKSGIVDVIFPMNKSLYHGEEIGLMFSDAVLNTPMAAVSSRNNFNESQDNSVAVVRGNIGLKWYLSSNYPNWKIVDCDRPDDCERLVMEGNVDCLVTSAYRLNNYYDIKSLYCVNLSKSGSMAFAANRTDTVLMSVLNKTIQVMPESIMNGALTMYANPPHKTTFTDFIKDNAVPVVVIAAALAAVFITIAVLYVRRTRAASKKVTEALILAEHANQAKTNFLNNMSHDIRTPMNAIIGFTSLAAAHLDDKSRLEDYLKKIMTSSNHLLSLINDVLDMSRIESGRVKIEEKECNLPTIMHDLRNILQADVNAKRLNFLIDTVEVTNEDIICDKLRLNQVILNCMNNAIKFTMPGGTVGIKIIQKSTPKQDGYANFEFVISDTGIGMSEEFAKHIFEPFTREESSTVSGIPGTGLGMAITKNIVDMMGGTITVKSKQGEGTEFVISLRFRVGENSHKVTTIKNLEGLRALVADDNMDTCASVTRMLETIGMNPEWTMSGKEAVYKAKFAYNGGKPYKAFIIDWLMPDMNGVEVVRRIRSEIADDTPIIILTAYDWSEIEAEARQAGVTAFCAKPLFLSDLYEVLNNSVEAEPIKPKEQMISHSPSENKILLVEDNDLNREITSSILGEMNIGVEEAENGKVAVDMIRTSKPGYYRMVLMDIQMPVMDGYEATRAIRALDRPDAASIPIIAVSANAFEEDMKKSREAGMNEHITKPFNKDKLEEILARYLYTEDNPSDN